MLYLEKKLTSDLYVLATEKVALDLSDYKENDSNWKLDIRNYENMT